MLPCSISLLACQEKTSSSVVVAEEDASFGRRVFKAPTGEVRALPPHNIHRTGVGPYELGATFQKTLALLPSGPRVELFKVEGLFDYRLMRADNDALVLGVGRQNRLEFISVLDPDIARTESGVGVGAGLAELVGALGAVRASKDGGRDPRIVTFSSLPDTRFIVEKKRVVAAVVMPSSAEETPPAGTLESPTASVELPSADSGACRASDLLLRQDELLAAAKIRSKNATVLVGCLLSDAGEAVIRKGDALYVVVLDAAGVPKLWSELDVAGLSFAAIISTGPGRPELYTVAQRQDLQRRQVEVSRYKLTSGRMISTWSRTAFELEATSASWIGANIQAADFLVELTGSDGGLIVQGLYVQRDAGALRMVVPVDPVELPVVGSVRKEEPASPEPIPDAGTDAAPSDPPLIAPKKTK